MFVRLASTKTLFEYSHYTKSATGFQSDVTKMLNVIRGRKNRYVVFSFIKLYEYRHIKNISRGQKDITQYFANL